MKKRERGLILPFILPEGSLRHRIRPENVCLLIRSKNQRKLINLLLCGWKILDNFSLMRHCGKWVCSLIREKLKSQKLTSTRWHRIIWRSSANYPGWAQKMSKVKTLPCCVFLTVYPKYPTKKIRKLQSTPGTSRSPTLSRLAETWICKNLQIKWRVSQCSAIVCKLPNRKNLTNWIRYAS